MINKFIEELEYFLINCINEINDEYELPDVRQYEHVLVKLEEMKHEYSEV